MTGLTELWQPILLSAVLVFVASSLVHMVLPWHKSDYPKMPDEEKFRAVFGALNIPPGDYMVPRPASMDDMKSREFQEKMNQGPIVIMSVAANGARGMGSNLRNWFIYTVVVGTFAALVGGSALPHGSEYHHVFHMVGLVAFACYAMAIPQLSIWYHRGWSIAWKSMFDGLIYALLTAGTFGWLWPK